MTGIPDEFLEGNTDLTGTLKVGAAIRTIGASAFANTRLAGLDLSEATSLVSIGDSTFLGTDLGGTLVIPNTVTTIGPYAFYHSIKLTGLDLSKATSLVSIGKRAFVRTGLTWSSTIFATWDQYELVEGHNALPPATGPWHAMDPNRDHGVSHSGTGSSDEEDDAMRRRDD